MPYEIKVPFLRGEGWGFYRKYEKGCVCSVEAAPSKVVGNNDVSDSVEHKLNVGRVRSACHMAVDFLCSRFVLCFELSLDIGSCLTVLLST